MAPITKTRGSQSGQGLRQTHLGLVAQAGEGGLHQGATGAADLPAGRADDLALLVFGIVLHLGGWRVEFLGGNTPKQDTLEVTSRIQSSLVVMTAHRSERFTAVVPELSALARLTSLVLAGPGAIEEIAEVVGARRLTDDPVTAAERLAAR
jgi:hypothetical protein